MALPRAAERYKREQSALRTATWLGVRRLWRKLDGEFNEWVELGAQALAILTAGQLAVARSAVAYVPRLLDELDIDSDMAAQPNPFAVAGFAGSGVPLDRLMTFPTITAKITIGRGGTIEQALDAGEMALSGIVETQTSDAARAMESVASVATPAVKRYTRMLTLPSCPRCVILAGRVYRLQDAFELHPRCDCRHIPSDEDVAGDLRTDPVAAIKAGEVRGLSKADLRAIADDGADPAQVINAHRGMTTAQVGGQKLKVTTEGMSRRGLGGQRLSRGAPRLRPESIYKLAGKDRQEALRLLYRNGYLLSPPA